MKTCKSFARDGKGNDGRPRGMKGMLDGLLRSHEGKAMQFACKLSGNTEEAKELVQQASVQAFESWKGYDPLKSFKSWYLTIVKNLYLDARRRMEDRLNVSLSLPTGGDQHETLADVLPDGAPGPLEELERGELTRATRQSLDALSEGYKAVLVLCGLEGMSYEDAAQRLGLAIGTVRSRMSRARAALRQDRKLRRLA